MNDLIELAERLEQHWKTEQDDPYCNHHVADLCKEAAAGLRESNEEITRLRSLLASIRDATHTSAVVLRGMAAHALESALKEKE